MVGQLGRTPAGRSTSPQITRGWAREKSFINTRERLQEELEISPTPAVCRALGNLELPAFAS